LNPQNKEKSQNISTMRQISVILAFLAMSAVEARYRSQLSSTIPQLLERVYEQVGRDRFSATWKEFNSRNSDQQDDFLMADLSDEELSQLGEDFERLGHILAEDPTLVDLYADFEHNLNTEAFNAMDERLDTNHTWWGRIKKFLFRKMEKLADEIYRKQSGITSH